ncbi:TonB-linked SusC/RagA family outer membrane protein [Thermoflavifilum aggregans]|uniref:TonB-linked SusC/RagA family outer membrane protein n=1 Tax=Thermoflavifilum aggregans TaxID=454188 RepID=A0A2M9CUW3_9BACT|nr:TonB-dependent receptor [Thermoflavifilum aggregans]PJJ75714.1 TonB-linked SusC/RagA family outer membrane protein [Thermoflavifilum aggregans]
MKLTCTFLLLACLQVNAHHVYSQERLTLDLHNIKLKKALSIIEKNSNYRFLYSDRKIPEDAQVNIEARDAGITDVLHQILDPYHLSYKELPDHLIVIGEEGAIDQEIHVRGRVTDQSSHQPLVGVTIKSKYGNQGAITDINGNYEIVVPDTATLVVSFIGYETVEIPVNGRAEINIALKATNQSLNEVVVIGYGARQRKDLTGSIASIDSKEIEKSTAVNPELAMQGRMAGVYVSTPSGNPFDRPTIRIRGVSTFGYADPLIVIDGVPVIEGGASSGYAGDQDIRGPIDIMTLINPDDIESISVLKDASAAAIYGVRASNGVILITTKHGQQGTPRVRFSGYKGIQNAAKTLKLLNTQQYVNLYTEAYKNNPFAPPLPSVFDPNSPDYLGNNGTYDWQKAILNHNADLQDYNISVSGGNPSTTYYFSTGYSRVEGTLKAANLERYTVAANVTSKISKIFEAGINNRIGFERALNNTNGDLWNESTAPPWQPLYDPTNKYGYAPAAAVTFIPNPDLQAPISGTRPVYLNPVPLYIIDSIKLLWGPATRSNPLGLEATNTPTNTFLRELGSAFLQIQPIEGLKFKGTVSVDYYFNLRSLWTAFDSYIFSQTPGNPYSNNDGTSKGSYGERQQRNINLIQEFTAEYTHQFGQHYIDLLFDGTNQWQKWSYTDVSTGQVNSADPNQRNVANLFPWVSGFTGFKPQQLLGYMGRLSYKFGEKYYLDATLRRDGSSVFAPGHRWGWFPSFAVAWRVTQERFWKAPNWLNDLKIRGGWGQLGNKETTQGFAYLSVVSTTPDYALGSGNGDAIGTQVTGAALPNFPNFSLSWERVQTTNIGFDALLFRNSLSLTVEYYDRLTKGIIQSVSLPPNTGIQYPTDLNIGKVSNKGIEVTANYQKQFGKVDFNIGGNFTSNKNRVVSLYNHQPIYAAGGRVQEGYPIGYIYGYKVAGIFQNYDQIRQWRATHADVTIGQSLSDTSTGYHYQPGDMYFQDINSNPPPGKFEKPGPDSLINDNDRTYLGSTIPSFYYGFNVGVAFKGFDFSAFFQGIGGVKKYNEVRAAGEAMSDSKGANQWASVMNRWTPDHPSATMPRAVINDPAGSTRFSSRWIENAGFMRVKNIQLGYTFNRRMLEKLGFIESLRIYLSAVNLYTFTQWTGYDPENDRNPPARQFLVGVNAQF